MPPQTCGLCSHSLEDNSHGFDQNDGWMEGDKLIHGGICTYCKECNPVLADIILRRKQHAQREPYRAKQQARHAQQESLAAELVKNEDLRYSLRRARSAAKQMLQGAY